MDFINEMSSACEGFFDRFRRKKMPQHDDTPAITFRQIDVYDLAIPQRIRMLREMRNLAEREIRAIKNSDLRACFKTEPSDLKDQDAVDFTEEDPSPSATIYSYDVEKYFVGKQVIGSSNENAAWTELSNVSNAIDQKLKAIAKKYNPKIYVVADGDKFSGFTTVWTNSSAEEYAVEGFLDHVLHHNNASMSPMSESDIDHLRAVMTQKTDTILRHKNIQHVVNGYGSADGVSPFLSTRDRQKILNDLRSIAQKTVSKYIGQYKNFYKFAEFYDYKDADFLRGDSAASSVIPVYYCDLFDFVKANDDGSSTDALIEPFILVNSYIDIQLLEYLDKYKMSALVFGEAEKDADYGAIDLNVANAGKYSRCFRVN